MARMFFSFVLLQALPHLTLSQKPLGETVNSHFVPEELLEYAATQLYDAKACPNAASHGVESDFAHQPHLKLFAYELYDTRSWSALRGLRSCLEPIRVKTCTKNAWQGQESAYRTLEQTRAKDPLYNVTQWPKQESYVEHYLMPAKDTVLSTAREETAPMSSVSDDYILQQPCNALSNAAFYEVSLQICNATTFPNLPDWNWQNEAIVAGGGMAFGSFAMHSGATPGSASRDWYSTGSLDVISINQMFYLVHQALVRNLAVTTEGIDVVLNFGGYPDALEAVQAWAKFMESDGEYWVDNVGAAKSSTPEYTLSVIGIILVFIRSVLHPELFGAAADDIYEFICSALVEMMLPDPDASKAMACVKTSPFAAAILGAKWKVVKDIGVGLGYLGEMMEIFVEAFYWQETKAQPTTYMDPWRANGTISETSLICWQTPHANWHRCACQLIRGLMKLMIEKLPVMYWTPPLTQEQKQEAWANPLSAASKLVYTLRSKVVMSEANTINLCTIFARAALGAGKLGGVPLEKPRNLVDEKELNEFLISTLSSLDPYLDVANGTESFKAGCDYDIVYDIKAIHGLSCLRPKIDIEDFKYSEVTNDSSGSVSPVIEIIINFDLPATEIMAKADLNLKRTENCGLLRKGDHKGDAQVQAAVGLELQAKIVLDLGKIFSGLTEAVSVTLPKLELDCKKIEITHIDLSNFLGEDFLAGLANTGASLATQFGICDKFENKIVDKLEALIDEQIEVAAAAMPTSSGRRLLDWGEIILSGSDALLRRLRKEVERAQVAKKHRGRNLVNYGEFAAQNAGKSPESLDHEFFGKEWYCEDINLLAEGVVSGARRLKYQFFSQFVLTFAAIITIPSAF